MFNAYHEGQFFAIHNGVTGQRFVEMIRLWRIATEHGLADYEVQIALQNKSEDIYEVAFRELLRHIAETSDKNEAKRVSLSNQLEVALKEIEALKDLAKRQNENIKKQSEQVKELQELSTTNAQQISLLLGALNYYGSAAQNIPCVSFSGTSSSARNSLVPNTK